MEVPPTASRVSLVRASTTTLEVCWIGTPTAQAYVLEVQKIDTPPPPQPIPVTAPVAIVKKQHQAAITAGNAGQLTTSADIKEHLLSVNASPKAQTPIRGIAQATTPISYGLTTTQSVLSSNAISSPLNAAAINNAALNQQGQPIIITTSAPIPTLVSTSIVRQLNFY